MKKYLIYIIVMSVCTYYLQAQHMVLVKDSTLTNYMTNGFAKKQFVPSGIYENGLKTGQWQDYFTENDFEYTTINDVPQQIFGYYLQYAVGNYVAGKRQGTWEFYVIEDKTFKKVLQKKQNYVDGKLNGAFTYYFPNGNVGIEGNNVNDQYQGVVTTYYQNHKLCRTIEYKNGLRNNKHVVYYENGNKKIDKTFKNDTLNGAFTCYYLNGKVMDTSNYKKGVKDGNSLLFNEQGDLLLTQIYAGGKLVSEKKNNK